jgi:hypothetical protein
MRLIEMEPREDLCSPRHAPVDPGVENLALEPDPTEGFTVTLELGTYWVEWCGLDDREAVEAGTCRPSAGGPVRLRAPRRGRRERTVPDRDVTRAAAGREAIGGARSGLQTCKECYRGPGEPPMREMRRSGSRGSVR